MSNIFSNRDKITIQDINKGCTLLINKPKTWTSFDVLKKLKFIISDKNRNCKETNYANHKRIKIGHAGTLDPMAEGLLIVCTNSQTKNIQNFQNLNKTYKGEITLGATTASYDSETPILTKKNYSHIKKDDILNACKIVKDRNFQIPPVYSAIKINGKKCYNEARKGNFLKMPPRKVKIRSFDILSLKLPKIEFEIECSKGTYIRSIANDLGNILSVGGYLSSLIRLKIGDYENSNAYSIDELKKNIQNNKI